MQKNKPASGCSIRDLAEHVGLSTCTVSKVLNNRGDFKILDSTRQKVLKAARELNYVPNINAKRLFERRSGVIALLIPSMTEGDKVFADNHFINIIAGMESGLTGNDYSLLLKFNDRKLKTEAKYLELLRNGSVDGFLIWGAHRSDTPYYRELAESGAPHLFITSRPDDAPGCAPFNSVSSDYEKSSELLTARLIAAGCRNLLHLGGYEDSSVVQSMGTGLRAALTGDAKVYDSFGPYSRAEAKERALKLLRPGVFDGIVAVSARVADGAVEAMRELGIPEGKIKLVILDSSFRHQPPLPGECGLAVTDDREIGRSAIDTLAELIQHRTTRIDHRVPPELFG